MIRKIIVGVLVAIFSTGIFAFAQEWPTAQDIMSKVQAEMDLDAAQLSKVKAIVEENVAERQQVKPVSIVCALGVK